MDQRIGYATSADGTRIAYAVSGSGPPLARPGTALTHIRVDEDGPTWGHWWRELSRNHTLVRYDKRGSGLSQRRVPKFTLDAEVADLEAVVEAERLNSFDLLGHSYGALIAVGYLVKHPRSVGRLAIFNGSLKTSLNRPFASDGGGTAWTRRALMFSAWDVDATRKFYASWHMPGASRHEIDAAAELLGVSATAEMALKLGKVTVDADQVLSMLRKIQIPTLVLHSSGNEMVPVEYGRQLAAAIPYARFVELDSRNHILTASEPAWPEFLSLLDEFLSSRDLDFAAGGFNLDLAISSGLSRREAETLALICDGASDKEIATALGIEKRTASNHVNGLLRKTASRNRTHVVAWAARHRLIS